MFGCWADFNMLKLVHFDSYVESKRSLALLFCVVYSCPIEIKNERETILEM